MMNHLTDEIADRKNVCISCKRVLVGWLNELNIGLELCRGLYPTVSNPLRGRSKL